MRASVTSTDGRGSGEKNLSGSRTDEKDSVDEKEKKAEIVNLRFICMGRMERPMFYQAGAAARHSEPGCTTSRIGPKNLSLCSESEILHSASLRSE
jgi:hypothetical protein